MPTTRQAPSSFASPRWASRVRAANALARRSLAARPLRTALTVAGIALGVGVLVAALIVNAALDAAVGQSVRDLMGRADLRVAAFEEHGFAPATVGTIATTPGVAVVAPVLERRTYPLPDISTSALPSPLTVLGVERAADPAIHGRNLQSGALLGTGDDHGALVSATLAREDGLAVGSTITLLGDAAAPPMTFRVAGVLAPTPGDPDPAGRSVIVPLAAAHELFATDRVSAVDVMLADGADAAATSSALEARLQGEPYTLSTPADVAAALEASTAEIRIAIALAAAVALFGGAFLIFNTLSMTVAERVRDVGLLRAAGMTRRQVTTMVLLSAVHLGIAGVALGVLAGIALAGGAVVLLGGRGTAALIELPVPPESIVLGAVLGFLVTLAAAVEPALRAGGISPVAALRLRLDQGAIVRARLRWLLLVFAVVGLVGLALWPGIASGRPGLLRPLAVFGILLGVALLAPFVVGPLGRAVGLLAAPFLPAEQRLTRGSLTRDRSRSALTVGALAVALAVLVALAGVSGSTRQAATAWLHDVVPGDLLLTSIRPVGADEPAATDLPKVPGVARVSPIGSLLPRARRDAHGRGGRGGGRPRGGRAAAPGGRGPRHGVCRPRRRRGGDRPEKPRGAHGHRRRLDAGGPVGHRPIGAEGRWGRGAHDPGDSRRDGPGRLERRHAAPRGARRRRVRGPLPARAGADGTAGRRGGRPRVRPGAGDARPGGGGNRRLGGSPGCAFPALAGVALLVALLGILNTLAMNVIERVRELALLRAMGLTRRQAWRLVVLEAAILGVVGAVLGVLAGLAAGAALVVLAGGAAIPFQAPWAVAGAALVGGAGVAVLASLYPARLAARVEIVGALARD